MATPEVNFGPIDQPTPEQLERIVGLGMTLAKESGSIRQSRRPNAHVFLPAWVERPLSEEDYCATVQRIAGRIGKIGYRAYSLWLHEGMSFLEGEAVDVVSPSGSRKEVNLSNQENGHVNLYRFQWTSRNVLTATLHHRRFQRQGNGLAVGQVRQGGREQSVLVASPTEVIDLDKRRGEVSQADCDALIEQMRNYGDVAQRAA